MSRGENQRPSESEVRPSPLRSNAWTQRGMECSLTVKSFFLFSHSIIPLLFSCLGPCTWLLSCPDVPCWPAAARVRACVRADLLPSPEHLAAEPSHSSSRRLISFREDNAMRQAGFLCFIVVFLSWQLERKGTLLPQQRRTTRENHRDETSSRPYQNRLQAEMGPSPGLRIGQRNVTGPQNDNGDRRNSASKKG